MLDLHVQLEFGVGDSLFPVLAQFAKGQQVDDTLLESLQGVVAKHCTKCATQNKGT